MRQVGGGMHGGRRHYNWNLPNKGKKWNWRNWNPFRKGGIGSNQPTKGVRKANSYTNKAFEKAGMPKHIRPNAVAMTGRLVALGIDAGIDYLMTRIDGMIDEFLDRASQMGLSNYNNLPKRTKAARRRTIKNETIKAYYRYRRNNG